MKTEDILQSIERSNAATLAKARALNARVEEVARMIDDCEGLDAEHLRVRIAALQQRQEATHDTAQHVSAVVERLFWRIGGGERR